MKVFIGKDERYPDYIAKTTRSVSSVQIELSEEEYVRYEKAVVEYDHCMDLIEARLKMVTPKEKE